MMENPVRKLQAFGQSVWLDFIRRDLLLSGEFQNLMAEDGISGVTSNPTIFEHAIAGSHDYDTAIRSLVLSGKNTFGIYEALTIEDVRLAADLLFPLYLTSEGKEGYVSIEISPHLAYDTESTIAEARRVWQEVNRPNIMIKVPATKEGLPAIRELIREGINVNVTLLFSLERYKKVAEAYMEGLEARLEHALPIDVVRSVASFFVSRIDVKVDPLLENLMKEEGERAQLAAQLHGQIAISSAKLAYQIYKEIVDSERFRELARRGANPQRLLWASTSTKNPAYSDVKYIEALIGPDTITTIPMHTLNAYRDHGQPEPRLEKDVDKARWALDTLADLGIDLGELTRQLEEEGVKKFILSYEHLLEAIEKKRAEALGEKTTAQNIYLGTFQPAVEKRLHLLRAQRFVHRLWRKDASLWKQDPDAQAVIRNALGWLNVVETMAAIYPDLLLFAREIREAGFQHVVHIGMGGSSLAPLMFQHTFPVSENGLPLTVLDTTDPVTIKNGEEHIPLEKTLFIIATKSGTTAETIALRDYFYDRVKSIKGDKAGDQFIAITDPGSPLVDQARKMKFRQVFKNFSDIGGRYSALSYFGMVPAALMGIDIGQLLERAARMVHANMPYSDIKENPGIMLGAALGELALHGRDKVTFITTPKLATFGMWLEQLLAESTGKEGKGLLPIALEPIGTPDVYGSDRVFVYIHLKGEEEPGIGEMLDALKKAGHPVITIVLEDLLDIGQEFFRWEIATATAGAILGINAFDQPNVQESKDNTNRLLEQVAETGKLPESTPRLVDGQLEFYTEKEGRTAPELVGAFLTDARPGDYFAIQAYLTETDAHTDILQAIRRMVRDRLHLATTLGYGPRFLHSTGQYHKGGPNTGLFLQLTCDDPEDVPIPGRTYTFGTFKLAQALGDLEALHKHGRRVIRVHLRQNPLTALEQLQAVVEAALE